MSDRRQQYGSKTPNPAVRYYEWASDEHCFRYYDKEKKENVKAFPLKFAVLTERASVKGWNDATSSGIYSNEVKNLKQETINVYSSKPDGRGNTLLFTGIYSEGKSKIESVGGHFNKAIYAYEFGVGIVKIDLKGASAMGYSTFTKNLKNQFFDNFITVEAFTEEKKGKVKYTTPTFELGTKFTKEEDDVIAGAYDLVDGYFAQLSSKKNDVEEDTDDVSEPVLEETTSDGLPF